MGKEGAVGERARALRTGKNYSRELYFHSHSIFLHLQSEFPAWELSPNCILWWDSAGLNLSATWRVSQRKKHLLEKLRSLGENSIPKTKEAAQWVCANSKVLEAKGRACWGTQPSIFFPFLSSSMGTRPAWSSEGSPPSLLLSLPVNLLHI